MEKPISKGGFCPDCFTHTNTYYADQPRKDLVSSGSLRNDVPEKVVSIVNELPKPREKIQKYSREEIEKERKEQLAQEIKNKSSINYNITTIERDKRTKERKEEEQRKKRERQYRLENPDPEEEKKWIQGLERSIQSLEEMQSSDEIVLLYKAELEKHKKRLKKVEESKNLKTQLMEVLFPTS
jgi:hypothetical protein